MPFTFSRCLCNLSLDADRVMHFYRDDMGLPMAGSTDAPPELTAAGCTVVRWEGKGNCCYMQDPFGF